MFFFSVRFKNLVSPQCLLYQVMDHTDNLNQVNDDIMNVETNIEGIDNRVTAAEANIVLLETAVEELGGRTFEIEQIVFGKKI